MIQIKRKAPHTPTAKNNVIIINSEEATKKTDNKKQSQVKQWKKFGDISVYTE